MADTSFVIIDVESGAHKKIKLVDNGDGTFSIASTAVISSADIQVDTDDLEALVETTNSNLDIIKSPYRKVDFDLTVDTGAYASGDVLADLQAVSGVFRANDIGAMLLGFKLLDPDDQTEFDFDLVFSDAAGTLGTENDAVNISDADAAEILGIVRYRVADNPSCDLINSKSYTCSPNHKDMPMVLTPVSGTDDVMVGAILRSGTPTFAGGVLKVRLFLKDC